MAKLDSYAAFHRFYLDQHSHPVNRALHAAGTALGVLALLAAIAARHPWWGLLGLPLAYAFAWTGHFVFEGNRPATFGRPLWSLASDFRMIALMLARKRG